MKFTREIKVGITAVCAIALLIYGLNFLKGINIFQKNDLYYVAFHDIKGLAESNPVYANGYRIGIVRTINYDYEHPGNVYVGVEVDDNMHITEGSRAELVSQMLGGVTMNIVLGQSPKALSPGDTIYGGPLMGALDQVADMMPQVQNLLPKVDSILTSVNTIICDPNIQRVLANAAGLTEQLKTTTDALNSLMTNQVTGIANNLETATGGLEPAVTNLTPITENLKQLSAQLNQLNYSETLNNVNKTLAELQQLSGNLSSKMDNTFSQVDNTVSTINQKLNSTSSSLGMLMNDTKLYDNLNSTLRSSDSLLVDLRQHPKRYVHFSIFGKKDK